jgi:hypothetical protein
MEFHDLMCMQLLQGTLSERVHPGYIHEASLAIIYEKLNAAS